MKTKQIARPLLLFDLDGTLTPARKTMTTDMKACLEKMKSKFDLAIVGGSDRKKQLEQMGEENIPLFKYVFSENGTHSFKGTEEFHKNSIGKFLGEKKLQEFINYSLKLLSTIDGKGFILLEILK
jgi:phosphomannomutase